MKNNVFVNGGMQYGNIVGMTKKEVWLLIALIVLIVIDTF